MHRTMCIRLQVCLCAVMQNLFRKLWFMCQCRASVRMPLRLLCMEILEEFYLLYHASVKCSSLNFERKHLFIIFLHYYALEFTMQVQTKNGHTFFLLVRLLKRANTNSDGCKSFCLKMITTTIILLLISSVGCAILKIQSKTAIKGAKSHEKNTHTCTCFSVMLRVMH